MKFIYKGFLKDKEMLPKGELPTDAVIFKEPKRQAELFAVSALFILPALAVIAVFIFIRFLLYGEVAWDITIAGLIASLIIMIPHEFLHAICFGKGAQVEMYVVSMGMCVVCTKPITKARFIFLSMFPNILFGMLPMVIWVLLPYIEGFSSHLFTFAAFGVLSGVGDYLNVFNATRQMPKGSMQQLSGFNSYWFMPLD